MTDRNAGASAHTTFRDLFQPRSRERTDTMREELLAQIVHLVDTNSDLREVMPLVRQLRARGETELTNELDRYLLQRVYAFERARQDLESAFDELKSQIERLLSPPYFPARFLGTVTTAAGEYARVSHDGVMRLVAFAPELGSEEVRPGDEVYLGHERNVVVAKAQHARREVGETAALVRAIGADRLVLDDRDTEVVVSLGSELTARTLKPGDAILWDRAARIALGRLEASGASTGYEEIDAEAPQRLAGLDAVTQNVLDRFVLSILNPELARRYRVLADNVRRLLLIGAPGTGKTTLMRMVAALIARESEQRCRVVTISGAELYSSYVGETERNIRRCFATLSEYDGPGIAFFDELDAIGRARGHRSGYHDDRFLGTLLAELEGMRSSNVAVIAATNRADVLDPALRARFAWELTMPRPTLRAARQIFAAHMAEDVPYRPNGVEAPTTRQAIIEAGVARLYEPNADNMIAAMQFRDGQRREVAARELVSGRLIEQICAAARAAAFERGCRGGEPGIGVQDMQAATGEAIERLRNTLTAQNAKSYLSDLPQDLDVVSVEAIRPRVDAARYAR